MSEPSPVPARPRQFARYWCAAAISSFGTAVTAVAIPVLVVRTLGATPFEVGAVNAAQFLPYAVLGLIAGAYVDRWPRRAVLVWSSVGRALALGAIPVLWSFGALQVWTLLMLGYWKALTPDGLLGRVNATRRSANRTIAVIGSILGGTLLTVAGVRATILVVTIVFGLATVIAAFSPLRTTATERSQGVQHPS